MKDQLPVAAVVLLALVLISGTVLCAIGAMTKTEMLPLLGGTVVVAHRLLDGAIQRRKEGQQTKDKGSKSIPPSAGVTVLLGMVGGSVAAMAGLF